MTYVWDSDLETGHAEIDNQHRELFAIVNRLIDANLDSTDTKEIAKIVVFLINYADKHFRDEEELQLKYKYPDYTRHKIYHNEFKAQIGELTLKLNKEGVTTKLINDAADYVGSWLISHIKGDDFVMAAYVKEQESRLTSPK